MIKIYKIRKRWNNPLQFIKNCETAKAASIFLEGKDPNYYKLMVENTLITPMSFNEKDIEQAAKFT